MNDRANLERAYRRMLAWYPRDFRRERGQEILAVLMDCTPEGQRRPRMAARVDLIRSGLWMRLRPRLPQAAPTVRAAIRLMYAGATLTILGLIVSIISLADMGRRAGTLRVAGRSQPLAVAVVVGIVGALIVIALWLWMARANSQGRNWARIVSSALVGLTTLHLFGNHGAAAVMFAVLTWLVGLTAVWLLWCPTSRAFFEPGDPSDVGSSA
jgi:hypothetical protein